MSGSFLWHFASFAMSLQSLQEKRVNFRMFKWSFLAHLKHLYTVLKEDLLTYIEDSANHPEKYVTPYAEFSTAKYTTTRKPQSRKTGFPSSLPSTFRPWLEQEFESVPDALTMPQVIATTGYTDSAINRWLRQGHLKYVQIQTTKIIPKLWLIDFYCSYAYTISNMSDKHIKLLQKLFKQNE